MNNDTSGRLILSCGGGCLLLTLIASTLALLGSISLTESCSKQIADSNTQAVRPIQRFLDATADADFDTAWSLMSLPYRQQFSARDLKDLVLSHEGLFIGGRASLLGVKVLKHRVLITVDITNNITSKGIATFSLSPPHDNTPDLISHFDQGWPRNLTLQRRITQFIQAHFDTIGRLDIDRAHLSVSFADRDTFAIFVQAQGNLYARDAQIILLDLQEPTGNRSPFDAVFNVIDRPTGLLRGKVVFSLLPPDALDRRPLSFDIVGIQTHLDNIPSP